MQKISTRHLNLKGFWFQLPATTLLRALCETHRKRRSMLISFLNFGIKIFF